MLINRYSRMSKGEIIFDGINTLLMCLLVVVTLYPFLNVVAVAFNESSDTVLGGLTVYPRKFTWDNFQTIVGYQNLATAYFNTVARTVIGTLLGVFVTSMIAFGLTRKEFRARRFVSMFLVTTMYVSGGLIPFFLLIKALHLMNTFFVYILPGIVGVFNVFMIRSFMDNLPAELSESAFMDGASYWVVYSRIILPLCKPVLATIALFVAVGHWNSWFDAYLYNGSTPELTVLQFELMKILQSAQQASQDAVHATNMIDSAQKVSPDSIKMAITVVTIAPILVVYPFLQRYFVSGMTLGAVKA